MGDILLFPGQGSTAHLSDRDALNRVLEELGDDRPTFDAFVQECRESVLADYHSLPSDERSAIDSYDELGQVFKSNDSFLIPPSQFHSHPVFETSTLYLRQILELVLYQSRNDSPGTLIETAGVCTGVLPAILAATTSSYLSHQFLKHAVQGCRLAFWIGLRGSQFCQREAGEGWAERPWALSVFGLPVEDVEEKLTKYVAELTKTPTPRISAVFARDNLSLSGGGAGLDQLKNILSSQAPSAHFRSAHVHGFYHGGLEMIEVMEQVMEDAKRREIWFPAWQCLLTPVRSAATGALMASTGGSQSPSLLEVALRSIFVDTVAWQRTMNALTVDLAANFDEDTERRFRVIGMGPNASSLVRDAKTAPLLPPARVSIIDHFSEYIRETPPDAFAIVGLSVNYPSGKGHDEFWDTLESATSTVTSVPESRFDISRYRRDAEKAKQKPPANLGNFLEEPFKFDAAYFNISPREAKCMDPQQRLLLHAAAEALEDAGYAPNTTPTFRKDKFGVYVGVATGDYVDNLRDDIDVYYSPGTLRAFLSGRISYALGLKGPSIVFDTACSSSMVALHHACRGLQAGDCTVALAGGVNVMTSPYMHLGLSRAHFLSSTGQCKPFDAGADGYCRAEGCGLVVVKKLTDAVREGDHIYGVVRGIGINQCGTAKSITHPDSETQAELFQDVLSRSRVEPETIGLVEAHGTGTQAGDYAEISSLQSVLGKRPPENPLHISSVKGNIGHAEAASGIAGLAKLLLALEKKKIPAQASFKDLNPRLASIKDHNIVVPTQTTEWKPAPRKKAPRRALLNNFGAAGSNAALVLEEYTGGEQRTSRRITAPTPTRSAYVLNISAKTPAALEQLRRLYVGYIEDHPEARIDDLCYTATARRREEGYSHRLSVVGSSLDELLTQLREVNAPPALPAKAKGASSRTLFVFSGQGGIYPGMGAELLTTAPRFRAAVDRCDVILSKNGFPRVLPYLAGDGSSEGPTRTLVEQSAIFVVEYALAQLFLYWGIRPDIVAGHSIGEFAALVTAEALELDDALLFVATRARLMTEKCPPKSSGMLACRLPAAEINDLLAKEGDALSSLSIACENSKQDSVVAGPLDALEKFSEICKDKGAKTKLLQVAYGFHSSAMDPILDDLSRHASSIKPCAREEDAIGVGLSSQARLLEHKESISSDYFTRQTRNTVQFSKLAEEMADALSGSDVTVIEVGPSPITLPMLKPVFDLSKSRMLPALKPADKAWVALGSLLQSLYLRGYPIRWREVYDASVKYLRSFPHYPLQGSDYVIPFKDPREQQHGDDTTGEREALDPPFEFLTSKGTASSKKPGALLFETPVRQLAPFIKAHAVGSVPMCPASIFMEFALEGAVMADGPFKTPIAMTNITFHAPLVYSEEKPATKVQLELDAGPELDSRRERTFTFRSKEGEVYCNGTLKASIPRDVAAFFARKEAFVKRQKVTAFDSGRGGHLSGANSFSSKTIYELVFPRVVAYADPFLTLDRLTVSDTGLEGYGQFRVDGAAVDGCFVCAPAFIDTLLHAAGFIANIQVDSKTACICTKIDQAMLPDNTEELYSQELDIYCSLVEIDDTIVGDAYVLTSQQKVVACVEGMAFKKIPKEPFKARLSRTAKQAGAVGGTQKAAPPKTSAKADTRASAPPPQPRTQQAGPDIVATVHAMLREVCGAGADIQPTMTLEEMGVDSLLFIELTQAISDKLPQVEVSRDELEGCKSVGDLVAALRKGSPAASATSTAASTAPSTGATTSSTDSPDSVSTPLTPPDQGSGIDTLLADVCGLSINSVDKDAALSSLGIDSLLSIELLDELKDKLGVVIDNGHEGISSMTIHDLEAAAGGKNNDPSSSEPQGNQAQTAPKKQGIFGGLGETKFPAKLQEQHTGEPKSSLYLFHDGSGLCSMYRRLQDLNREAYGIFSVDGSSDHPVQTMEELASMYIERAGLEKQRDVLLGGWSFGGVLAYEVSRQLRKRGVPVKGVVLIDSPVPVNHEPLPREVIEHIAGGTGSREGRTQKSEMRRLVEANFERHAAMLQRYSKRDVGRDQAEAIPCAMLHCSRTMDTDGLCGVSYPWLSDSEFRAKSIDGWERLLGRRLLVLDLGCNHFEVFDAANVAEVSEKLEGACAMLEGR